MPDSYCGRMRLAWLFAIMLLMLVAIMGFIYTSTKSGQSSATTNNEAQVITNQAHVNHIFGPPMNVTMQPYYPQAQPPSASNPYPSQLSVLLEHENQTYVYGYYVVLYLNGSQVTTCFTPCATSIMNGQTYTINMSKNATSSHIVTRTIDIPVNDSSSSVQIVVDYDTSFS